MGISQKNKLVGVSSGYHKDFKLICKPIRFYQRAISVCVNTVLEVLQIIVSWYVNPSGFTNQEAENINFFEYYWKLILLCTPGL